jgi:hypothetical protein
MYYVVVILTLTWLLVSFCQESFLGFELSCTKPGKTQANQGQDTKSSSNTLASNVHKIIVKEHWSSTWKGGLI